MRIIEPYYKIETPLIDMEMALLTIEKAGRTCYKSESKLNAETSMAFAKKLMKMGHLSVIEHVSASVRFITNRGVTHEIVRHRLASYCVSRDTEVVAYRHPSASGRSQKNWTIEQLYDWQSDKKRKGRLKLIRLRSIDDEGRLIPGRVRKVFKTGKKKVFLLTTLSGREIKATAKHRFLTANGYVRLHDLSVGDRVFANGGKIGMHSPEGIERLRESKRGDRNPMWKGDNIGRSGGYVRTQKNIETISCWGCEATNLLERHHLDEDPTNTDPENILVLCQKCHPAFHLGQGVLKIFLDEVVSIESAGEEETYDLEMWGPPHNFVANGFVVHNSQESTRYCNYAKEKFGKEITVIKPYWYDGAGLPNVTSTRDLIAAQTLWSAGLRHDEKIYFGMVELGLPAQAARGKLANDLKTEIVMTCNLREMRHFLTLRTAKAAHPDLRLLTVPLLKEMQKLVPVIFDDIVGHSVV